MVFPVAQVASAKQRWMIAHRIFDSQDPAATQFVDRLYSRLIGSGNKKDTFASETLAMLPRPVASKVIDALVGDRIAEACVLLFANL